MLSLPPSHPSCRHSLFIFPFSPVPRTPSTPQFAFARHPLRSFHLVRSPFSFFSSSSLLFCHFLLFFPHSFLFSSWQHLAFDGDECVGYLEGSCLSRLCAAAMLFVTASFSLAVYYLVGTDGFQVPHSLPVLSFFPYHPLLPSVCCKSFLEKHFPPMFWDIPPDVPYIMSDACD